MPSSHDDTEPGLDDLAAGRRINFRDYPSTGLVVLAALVSGLGWLAYKWSGAKRDGSPAAPDEPKQAQAVTAKPPAAEAENTPASPESERASVTGISE
ncbi:hypothetical protein [Microvirga sp. TS319]|uniref:hypothetical protein n=1 Tax=Microvirga sp. TS319 TaxID=3241165 RepID=UPI00351A23E0